ncbi:hypothetical protein Hanom_Chr09g00841751 [Helianthus anomalus]
MEREDKPVYTEDGKGKDWGLALSVPSSLSAFLFFELAPLPLQLFHCMLLRLREKEERWLPLLKSLSMRHSFDSWCDYVVASDSLEGLAPAVIRRPKPEPKDTADIPPSNPHDPIDLESSPKRLVRKKAGKRKEIDAEAEGQPTKKVQRKKITRRGNLDAFISEPVPDKPNSRAFTDPPPIVNEGRLPSPPRASFTDQLNTEEPEGGAEKAVGGGNIEVDKSVDVATEAKKITSPEVVDDAGNPQTPDPAAHDSEKRIGAEEIPVVRFSMLARVLQFAQMKLWGLLL